MALKKKYCVLRQEPSYTGMSRANFETELDHIKDFDSLESLEEYYGLGDDKSKKKRDFPNNARIIETWINC